MKRVLVAFDLDHTLIDKNSDTYVLRLLPDGRELPTSIKKLYSRSGWNDYMREVFRYLHSCNVTKEQLLSCVAEIPLVEGMRELLEYMNMSTVMAVQIMAKNDSSLHDVEKIAAVREAADAKVSENEVFLTQQQQHSMPDGPGTVPLAVERELSGTAVSASAVGPRSVVDGKHPSDLPVHFDAIIVSDSNSALIEHILETTGLQSMFSKVYTNPASFDESGCLHLSPYHRQDWCSLSQVNLCKGYVLDEHCRQFGITYDLIAYVGDGANDFCPTLRLRQTDIVFPRRNFGLEKHITEGRDKVAARVQPWDTGFDIMNTLKEVLVNSKA